MSTNCRDYVKFNHRVINAWLTFCIGKTVWDTRDFRRCLIAPRWLHFTLLVTVFYTYLCTAVIRYTSSESGLFL